MTIRFIALTMKGTLNAFSGSAGFLHRQIMFFHWQFCVVWKLTVLHLFGSLTVSVTVGWTVDSLECYAITGCVKGGDAWHDECLLVWKVSLGVMPGVTWEELLVSLCVVWVFLGMRGVCLLHLVHLDRSCLLHVDLDRSCLLHLVDLDRSCLLHQMDLDRSCLLHLVNLDRSCLSERVMVDVGVGGHSKCCLWQQGVIGVPCLQHVLQKLLKMWWISRSCFVTAYGVSWLFMAMCFAEGWAACCKVSW